MQTKTLAFGGVGVVAIAVAAAIYLRPLDPVPPADPVAVQTSDPVVETPQEDTVDVAVVDEVPADVPSDNAVIEDDPVEVTVAPAPLITDFRFEQDGALLVSGTAPIDAPLALMVDGDEIARVDIGPDGSFVMTQFIGFSTDARMMTLVSDPDGAAVAAERRFVLSANPEPVVVAAVEPQDVIDPIDPVAALDPVAAPETPDVIDAVDASPVADATPDTEDPAQQQVDIAVTQTVAPTLDPAPSSPAILAIDDDGVDVIQPAVAADAPPEVMSTVALDTITYDLDGEVILSGRALNDGFVQVYVDNIAVSRLPVADDGSWRTDLPDVDTGVYTLRIDEVDEDGEVVSRIETPFLREDPEDVVEAMAEDVADPAFTIATRTVQPGATLWAIAEERYGSGVLYVTVFEANKDRIRDPDLIYPGQVFMLPEDSN